MKTFCLRQVFFLTGGILAAVALNAQELYVFSEPASNMPSNSISAKATGRYLRSEMSGNLQQRYTPEVMFGLNKKWMLHAAVTFSDMYSSDLRLESQRIYAKYRFFSNDEVHKHLRMAVFGEVAHSRNDKLYDELSLEGDQSGLQGGLIMTQLWHKLALSTTLSYLYLTTERMKMVADPRTFQGYSYSVSAGYLVLPVRYTSFHQTNLNVYGEFIGQRSTDKSRYFIDFAPAIQLIFNSNAKLNLGYRFQLAGDMTRMAERGFLISFERTFLNALRN